MSEIRVEKNIPIPEKTDKREKYPWKSMDIGDSFLIEDKSSRDVAGLVWATNKSNAPKKFIYAAVDGGIRIWRKE